MFSVVLQGREYRLTTDTLDRLFADDSWRQLPPSLLKARIREHHRAGTLVIDGRRLRWSSPVEESEQRIRTGMNGEEILRWGFLHLASQIRELTEEVRALRETLEGDSPAASEQLARDPTGQT